MANTPSAKKATRKIATRTTVNKSRVTRVRTYMRKVEEAIASGDKDKAAAALKAAEPEIMRAVSQGRDAQEHRLAEGLPPDRAGEDRRRLRPAACRALPALGILSRLTAGWPRLPGGIGYPVKPRL